MDEVNPYECGPLEDSRPQPDIDPTEFMQLAASLDEQADGVDAYSQLTMVDVHKRVWIANRAALLRYAASCIRLASRDPNRDSAANLYERPPVEHFVVGQDAPTIVEIRHALAVPEPHAVKLARRRTLRLKDRLGLLGCAIIGFFLIGLVLSGCAFWFMVLSGGV